MNNRQSSDRRKRRRFKAPVSSVEALPEFQPIIDWIVEREAELGRSLLFDDVRLYRRGGEHKAIADKLHELNMKFGYEFSRMRLKAAELRAKREAEEGATSDELSSEEPNSEAQPCPCGQEHPPLPRADLASDEQREAWKVYWHKMAALHSDNADYWKNWWEMDKKQKQESEDNEIIVKSWRDSLNFLADFDEMGICGDCRKKMMTKWDLRDPETWHQEHLAALNGT